MIWFDTKGKANGHVEPACGKEDLVVHVSKFKRSMTGSKADPLEGQLIRNTRGKRIYLCKY